MPKLDILNVSGEKIREIELNDNVYGIEVNEHVLYESVKNYLANQRQGTQSAKTRAEVRGGGKKPFRQKGTGRARQGTTRAPHFVGGGVAFAPKPRDYSYKLPKKVKQLALRSALSSKVNAGEIIILDSLKIDAPKTKEMIKILQNVKADKKALVVTLENNKNVYKSTTNIKGAKASFVGSLNVYEILKYNTLILTEEAAKKIEEVYA
ncbi:50S ribosomal protein L4 [Helicovermis profundi]|uniref:Large ribosomal subunit protein uL4 n=1 Tax=Helicovermis profundi TaxID=3065157 RepID=A0AAU9ERW0_9FIRM|nr:50S ribosomal protein L4 [Clostridia bacterium S502]